MKSLIKALTIMCYIPIVFAATMEDKLPPGSQSPYRGAIAEPALAIQDKELLSKEIVDYFKGVAQETHKPISLKITLSDAYGVGTSLEDEKSLRLEEFPTYISRENLKQISSALKILLPSIVANKEPQSFMLTATIWVDAPNHKERINGFCSLG